MSARDYETAMEKVRLDESVRRRILDAAASPAPRRRLVAAKPLLAAAALLALVLAPVALRGLRGGVMTAKAAADAGVSQASMAAAPEAAPGESGLQEAAGFAAPQAAAAGGAGEAGETHMRSALGASQQDGAATSQEENAMTPFARAERLAALLGLEIDTWTEQRDVAHAPAPGGTDTTVYEAQAGDVTFTVTREGVYAQGAGLPEPPADTDIQVLERDAQGAPSRVFLSD